MRQNDGFGNRRRDCANATDDDKSADCERDADAQRDDRRSAFSVVACLNCLVPAIEEFQNRRAEADGDDCSDDQASWHSIFQSSTRVLHHQLGCRVVKTRASLESDALLSLRLKPCSARGQALNSTQTQALEFTATMRAAVIRVDAVSEAPSTWSRLVIAPVS